MKVLELEQYQIKNKWVLVLWDVMLRDSVIVVSQKTKILYYTIMKISNSSIK
jgi:hypothetical protein